MSDNMDVFVEPDDDAPSQAVTVRDAADTRVLSQIEIERRKKFGRVAVTHGLSHTKEHEAWLAMRARCHNPNNPAFHHYGGRGISVCKRWDDFLNFLADMGPRPSNHELERIDNDRGYFPGNCRWVTRAEQMRNTRRTIRISRDGLTMCLKDWCKELGQNYALARRRIVKHHWPIERALLEPPAVKYNRWKNR